MPHVQFIAVDDDLMETRNRHNQRQKFPKRNANRGVHATENWDDLQLFSTNESHFQQHGEPQVTSVYHLFMSLTGSHGEFSRCRVILTSDGGYGRRRQMAQVHIDRFNSLFVTRNHPHNVYPFISQSFQHEQGSTDDDYDNDDDCTDGPIHDEVLASLS